MKQKDRSRLYILLLKKIGKVRLSRRELMYALDDCANEFNITLTWTDRDAELGHLADEFAALSGVLDGADNVSFALYDPGAGTRQVRLNTDFNAFFLQRFSSYDALTEQFQKQYPDSDSPVTGEIGANVLVQLLERGRARPLGSPLEFVTDPEIGVLDAAAMDELYKQRTGA